MLALAWRASLCGAGALTRPTQNAFPEKVPLSSHTLKSHIFAKLLLGEKLSFCNQAHNMLQRPCSGKACLAASPPQGLSVAVQIVTNICCADEDEEEGTGEDDLNMLPAESASSAATYWDKLLRHHCRPWRRRKARQIALVNPPSSILLRGPEIRISSKCS